MEIGADKKALDLSKENKMLKRKRLDARAFRQWHTSQAKKHKTPICRQASPVKPDTRLSGGGSLKASCIKEQQRTSKIRDPQCEKQRLDHGVKFTPTHAEVPNKESGVSIEVLLSDYEKPESVGINKNEMEGEHNCNMRRSELSDCNQSVLGFSEYWVPVGFSHLQLEKYCETMVKNSGLLCSPRKGNVDNFHDVLSTIRKCCNHPYLADHSLERFVNEGRPSVDSLRTGIEVSGKLLLLDKLLQEVREKQLRVLIVFQSNNSNSLRYILDDFICQRFGEQSYEHVYREYDSTKKRALLDRFNDKRNGRFVVLMDKSSCQSSIKLSSVDFVILFNSDWRPFNDMKALRKISIRSKFDQVKVLRLYSLKSVEEKVLILARNGIVLDSSICNFSLDICHTLLLWGASYLFTKLYDFQNLSSHDNLNSLVEQELLRDVLDELSSVLFCQDSNNNSCSLISKVPEAKNSLAKLSLYGEEGKSWAEDDMPHYAVWTTLLEPMNPQWKLLRTSSVRTKRGEYGPKDHVRISKRFLCSRRESLSSKPGVRKACMLTSRRKATKIAGHAVSGGNGVNLSSSSDEAWCRSMQELILEQKKEIREFYRTKSKKRAILDAEHQSQLDLIGQRYGETTAKQQELKRLDDIYKRKIDEFNDQMDLKKKKLEEAQRASRMKEKQLKDRWLEFPKRSSLESPISSTSSASLLNSEMQRETVELVKRPFGSLTPISKSVIQLESRFCEDIEKDMVYRSCQGDPGLAKSQLLAETEALSVESNGENECNGENDAALLMKPETLNSASCNDLTLVPKETVSQSTSTGGKPCLDVQHMSDMETEGDGSTNMEHSEDTLALNVHTNKLSVSLLGQSLESEIENNVMLSSEKAPEASIKRLNDASNLCSSDGHQLCALAGQNEVYPLLNVPNKGLHDGEFKEIWDADGETGNRVSDLDLTSVARDQIIKHVSNAPVKRLASNSSVSVQPDRCERVMVDEAEPQSHPQQSASSGQKFLEQSSSLPNGEVYHRESGTQPNIGGHRGQAEGRDAAEVGMMSNVSRQDTIENLRELSSSRLNGPSSILLQSQASTIAGNSSVLEQALVYKAQPPNDSQDCLLSLQKSSVLLSTLPNREAQHGENEMESHISRCIVETEDREAGNMDTIANLPRQESIESLRELPLSALSGPSCVSGSSEACTTKGVSASLEPPMISAMLPSHEIRQTYSPLLLPSFQMSGVPSSRESHEFRASLRNLEPCGLPMEQPAAVSTSPFQSSHDLPSTLNVTGTSILPPANSYLQEISSLTSDISASTAFDSLHNELTRMRREEEEATKVHAEKVVLLKSACAKETEEIQKKYDSLVQEAENALQHKKEDLEFYYKKVCANKILAGAMVLFSEQVNSEMTQARLHCTLPHHSAMPHQPAMHHLTSDLRILPRGGPTAPPVQVVHHLSELLSFGPSNSTGSHLPAPQTWDTSPHLSPYQLMSSLPLSHNPVVVSRATEPADSFAFKWPNPEFLPPGPSSGTHGSKHGF